MRATAVVSVALGLTAGVPVERAVAVTNTHAIEGYSDVLSVLPGKTIKVSVHVPSAPKHAAYDVEILRFGAQDAGGNAVGESVAGPFHCTNGGSRDYDAVNAYVAGAGWPVSFKLKVPSATKPGKAPCTKTPLPPSTWKSGIYSAKLTDPATGAYFHVTFVVKDTPQDRKSIALLASTNTWQAYNFWPGEAAGAESIYDSCSIDGVDEARNKVSFLRPNPQATPETVDAFNDCLGYPNWPYYRSEHLAAGELRIAHWLEAQGESYSMLTDWDVDTLRHVLDPAVFKTVIISTHSEYWSQAMYDALRDYLAAGGNVVSLSGNTIYWRVMLAREGKNRTLEKGINWTPQEEADLLGTGFKGYGNAECAPYSVLRPGHWAFATIPGQPTIGSSGVILRTSKCLGGPLQGASGWEIDGTNPSLHVFAREYAQLAEGQNTAGTGADLVYVRRASAGQVLSGGSITFGQSLLADPGLGAVVLQVLGRFGALSFGDFTHDGVPDVLARKTDGTLWRYDGVPGGLRKGVQIDAGWSGYDAIVAPGDFDGDGNADVIARDGSGDLQLRRGQGDGTLVPGSTQIGTGWQGFDTIVAPGDFDDDGRPDLLARQPDGTLWLYRGTGDGHLVTPGAAFDSGWQIFDLLVAPGDFDRDGNPDLLARKPDGTLWLYRGNGDGTLVPGGIKIDTGWDQFAEVVAVGDLSGDGKADVLARKPDGTLWLYRGQGDGTFEQGTATRIASGWQAFDAVVGVW
jgi:hypothetical protein